MTFSIFPTFQEECEFGCEFGGRSTLTPDHFPPPTRSNGTKTVSLGSWVGRHDDWVDGRDSAPPPRPRPSSLRLASPPAQPPLPRGGEAREGAGRGGQGARQCSVNREKNVRGVQLLNFTGPPAERGSGGRRLSAGRGCGPPCSRGRRPLPRRPAR